MISLTDLGEGQTRLRMAGLGYPATEDGQKMRKFFDEGNAYVLKFLQSKFDAGAAKPTGPAHSAKPQAAR